MSGFRIPVAVAAVIACLAVGAEGVEGDLTSEGTKQLIFGFSGFVLSSYGGGVGMRYFLADGLAVTPGISVSLARTDSDGTDYDSRYYDTREARDDRYTDFRAKVTIEKYLAHSGNILPYLGGGAGYSYGTGDRTTEYYTYEPEGADLAAVDDEDWTAHGMNLFLAFGIQWAFTERVSLGGQYSLVLSHQWRESTLYYRNDGRTRMRTQDRETTTFDTEAGGLLVSIRF